MESEWPALLLCGNVLSFCPLLDEMSSTWRNVLYLTNNTQLFWLIHSSSNLTYFDSILIVSEQSLGMQERTD